jgi:hypothetical protein
MNDKQQKDFETALQKMDLSKREKEYLRTKVSIPLADSSIATIGKSIDMLPRCSIDLSTISNGQTSIESELSITIVDVHHRKIPTDANTESESSLTTTSNESKTSTTTTTTDK